MKNVRNWFMKNECHVSPKWIWFPICYTELRKCDRCISPLPYDNISTYTHDTMLPKLLTGIRHNAMQVSSKLDIIKFISIWKYGKILKQFTNKRDVVHTSCWRVRPLQLVTRRHTNCHRTATTGINSTQFQLDNSGQYLPKINSGSSWCTGYWIHGTESN